ncbi:hypothetical protein ACQ5RT_05040 [Limosilactobacillus fermentum]
MKITNGIIAKVASEQAKEYSKYASKPMDYGELLYEFRIDSVPCDEVETHLWEKQEIKANDSLEDYVTAGEYASMLNDIILYQGEPVDATDFRSTFDEWFCIELEELMVEYGINLDAPVDVDAMARMAENEKQED